MEEHRTNRDIRVMNTKRLVNILFKKGQMTKQELASQLGISQPTVATIVKNLEQKGLVRDGEILNSTGGRKPLCHMPIYDAKYSIGVESSRHQVRIVMLDLGNNCIASEDIEMESEYTDEYWGKINSRIHEFIDRTGVDKDKLLTIGITIDETMSDGSISKRRNEDEIDLTQAARQFDFDVSFRNSAKMAAVAQIWTNEELDNYVYVNMGTNIRGAMIYENLVVDFKKINCEFGNLLAFDSVSKTSVRLVDSIGAGKLLERAGVQHVEEFIVRASEGDELCLTILQDFIINISIFLYNVKVMTGWNIVVGGRLCKLIEKYEDEIHQEISKYIVFEDTCDRIFKISKNGDKGAVIGAALFPLDQFLSQDF